MRTRHGMLGLALVVGLSGCMSERSASGAGPGSMVVCDSQGCVERPADFQSFDPATAVPDADPDGLLPVLEAEARADPRAAYDLGLRYMRGDGIRRNPYEALQWMRDAGARGEVRAQAALGRLYLTGLEEMGADYNEAAKWLSLAAARGDRKSAELLSEAEAARADEQGFQTALRRWRSLHTRPYWYRGAYYGGWRPGWGGYRYY